jgi:murein DD-endopeptidase MepM/ murein hydrolase activator NlpD
MGARHFEPDDGRFLQQDFLRDASEEFDLSLNTTSENRYALAGGNPVTFAENDGHAVMVIPIDGGGGTAPQPRHRRYPKLVYPFPRGVPKRITGTGTGPYRVHNTAGLPCCGQPQHRAIDFRARAGTKVLAVVTGRTYWLGGGSSPSKRPECHGAYGWNFYLRSSSTGIDYFYTHLATRRVRNGGRVRVGQIVGTVANWHQWDCGIKDHIHLGATGPDRHVIAVYKAPRVRPRR